MTLITGIIHYGKKKKNGLVQYRSVCRRQCKRGSSSTCISFALQNDS